MQIIKLHYLKISLDFLWRNISLKLLAPHQKVYRNVKPFQIF